MVGSRIHPVTSLAWEGQERRRAIALCKCPVCGENFRPGVEAGDLAQVEQFPYRHVVLHGSPLHAVVVYFDANFAVRSVEGAHSVEVARGSATLQEVLRKWANPS